jgi:hypothetical protein
VFITSFFSKFALSVLRHIRVASKQELKERIMAGIVKVGMAAVMSPIEWNRYGPRYVC